MKGLAVILLQLWLINFNASVLHAQTIKSSGSLHFKCNGQLFTADNIHARGYVLKQTDAAFINAANTETFVLSVEWKGYKGPGVYIINANEGKAAFTVNHKSYLLKQTGDYIKVVISSIKPSGSFILLNGTFDGQLQDKSGNKIKITEGKFETISL